MSPRGGSQMELTARLGGTHDSGLPAPFLMPQEQNLSTEVWETGIILRDCAVISFLKENYLPVPALYY